MLCAHRNHFPGAPWIRCKPFWPPGQSAPLVGETIELSPSASKLFGLLRSWYFVGGSIVFC